jgi:Ca2+-transporting ATPase
MDGPPAQSLGVEPVDPAVMNRPPRSRNEQILTRAVLLRILTSAITILLGTIFIYVIEMHDGVVTARDTTMTFTCFVLFDMALALSCRSESKSILRGEIKVFGNKMFNFAVIGCLVGQMAVIYVPGLQNIFQTEALSIKDLILLLTIASMVFWVEEARKWAQGRRDWSSGYSGNV